MLRMHESELYSNILSSPIIYINSFIQSSSSFRSVDLYDGLTGYLVCWYIVS